MSNLLPTKDKLPQGPFYIDTESCQCALQLYNQTAVTSAHSREAWRCIGDHKENAYTGENGKWFLPTDKNDGSLIDTNESDYWAGTPPDLQKTYIINNATHELQPLDANVESQLSIVDQACSGQNDTEQSTRYYDEVKQVESGNQPIPPPLCYGGTQPVELQNASAFADKGCNLGFFCKSSQVEHEVGKGQWSLTLPSRSE